MKRSNPFSKYALSSKKARKYRQRRQPYGMLLSSSRRSRAEIKTVDTVAGSPSATPMAFNTTGTVNVVNLIQPGDEFFNRIGRRIEMKSLYLNALIQFTSAPATANMDYARLVVVYDRQPNGVAANWGSVFASFDQTGMSTSTALSNLNPNNAERYAVLADIRLALPEFTTASAGVFPRSQGPTDGTNPSWCIKRFINLKNLKAHYLAANSPSTVGDISSGALLVMSFGSYNAGSEAYQAQVDWRLRYTDT